MTSRHVSVVIPSHRPSYLRDLLHALSGQTLEQSHVAIVAVCDYPIDTLREDFPSVEFLRLDDPSISRKRNAGVALAQSSIIAFIDDDCVPSPDWLAAGLDYCAQHPEAAAVEGLTTVESGSPHIPALRDYRRLEAFGLRTNNLFCRKSAFLDAGGFDERFTVQREDLDFCFTLLDKGHPIHRSESIKVMHRIRTNEPWDLLKNCRNRRFDPLLFKKHPERYRKQVGSPFPPTLLALLALHLIACGCAVFGPTVFAAAAAVDGLGVTIATARRCARRTSFTIFMIEWISVFSAPGVLLGALIAGSIRFRRLLIV